MSEELACVVYQEKMVGTEEGSLEYRQVVNLTICSSRNLPQLHLVQLDFFIFFNDHFLLFVLASVVANHKTATEAGVLNKIVLKYFLDKIGASGRGKTVNNDE